ncbi:hypothetical protein [Jannaschia formosa]|uniref:hypothetical protein n=1 Tax=Jannaschia formosa TaxID=2259592 RepID=UPI000E1B8EC4|nr:hypothetical protein [Jannaschia formosa]TFL18502.1 hypothetical protein DR046_08450 [Jannaschia formosa]
MTFRPLLLALPFLAACVSEAPAPVPAAGPPPLDPTLGPIALAEQGCLRAVSQASGVPDVRVFNSDFAETGTVFQIGVGPANVLWRCIGYADGSTAGVAPLA